MIIAALLLMQAATAAEAPPCRVLQGGFADGMCIGPTERDSDGNMLVSLLPAPAPGPSIPPDIARILDRLLKARAKGRLELPAKRLAEGGTMRFCTDWTEECMQMRPLTAWPFGAEFASNPPYLLPDGGIRIEWMLGVELTYMSVVTFDETRITNIDTTPATIPVEGRAKRP